MENKRFLMPTEIACLISDNAKKKAESSWNKLLVLGIFAGMFIAFAANGSTMTAHNLLLNPETFGLGKTLTGFIFGVGLMLVIITGSELFTGNNLMIMGVLEKKITWRAMFRNWGIVYFANMLGSLIMVVLVINSGLLSENVDYGGMTIQIAALKLEMSFFNAVLRGILCNILVCGAVWMSLGAVDITGKLLACFFPIWLFVTSGFEHSVANMFYIPAGILAKATPSLLEAAHLTETAAANLTWANFFINNLIPVTIGNIIGGAVIVGFFFWYCHLRKAKI